MDHLPWIVLVFRKLETIYQCSVKFRKRKLMKKRARLDINPQAIGDECVDLNWVQVPDLLPDATGIFMEVKWKCCAR